MKKIFFILGIIGLLIAIYGVTSAVFTRKVTWYSYFIVGGTLFLAWINYVLNNDSLFEKRRIYILKTYGIYLLFTILVEVVGRVILNLWEYPSFGLVDKLINVFLIGYPFNLFFLHEFFKLIRKKVSSFSTAVFLTTIINAFLHEIPNTFVWEWVYKIPYVTIEIFQINIVVIFGWVILVSIALITKKILEYNVVHLAKIS